jgi:hypothetical protein
MITPGLHARVSKAFRVRGTGVRQVYFNARRAERFLRDAPRRAALRALPSRTYDIDGDRGFLVLPPHTFEETPAVIADARVALHRFNATSPPGVKNRKRFLLNVLDPASLTLEAAAMRLALRDDLLSAISYYLGVVPFLTAISVFHSDTIEGTPTSSQLYHCDGDDVTQVKVFVYCTDVDARSGPLTMLDAATTARVQRSTRYQFRQRLTDEQVREVTGDAAGHPIVGPAGTTALVDTSRCFHFGSRVAPNTPARLVTMIQFQTPYSFMLPTSAQTALSFRRLIDPSLGALQRLVLGE